MAYTQSCAFNQLDSELGFGGNDQCLHGDMMPNETANAVISYFPQQRSLKSLGKCVVGP